MSLPFTLFDLFSVLYAIRGLQLARVIWRNRAAVLQPPLTPQKKQWAEQAAFFLAVPPGVVVHEFGHMVATWLAGGQVAQFGFRVFWGYIIPRGNFSLAQDWLIAVAGTLGSLLYGVGVWAGLRRHRAATLRYFGLRAFRFQLYFSLLYYPVFTLLGFVGDWRTIYDFSATPLLSGLAAAVHLGIVAAYWVAERQGRFEMLSFPGLEEERAFARLREQAAASPQDDAIQARLVEWTQQGGAMRQAEGMLRRLMQQEPGSSRLLMQRALLNYQRGKGRVSKKVRQDAGRALELGLADSRLAGLAHYLLGKYAAELDRVDEALRLLGQAASELESVAWQGESLLAQLYLTRSTLYWRRGERMAAGMALEKAIALAEGAGDHAGAERYRQLLAQRQS